MDLEIFFVIIFVLIGFGAFYYFSTFAQLSQQKQHNIINKTDSDNENENSTDTNLMIENETEITV